MFQNLGPKIFQRKSPNYYIKIAITYFVLLAIAIIIFSSFIMVVFTYQSERLITESNEQSLRQVNNFTDKYLLEKIDYLCDEYFVKESSHPDINNFFEHFQDMPKEDMTTLYRTLRTIKDQNPFLHNLLVYNGKFDSLVSTDDGVIFGASDTRNQLTIDNRMFSYLEGIKTDFWIPQDDNITFKDQTNILTYVHYVSVDNASAFGKNNVNCVIISIDIEDIVNFINNINIPGIQGFLILDENQRILTHSPEYPYFSEFINHDTQLSTKIAATTNGLERSRINNSSSYVIWTQSKISNWKYVYALSLSAIYQQTLFIIIVITLLTLAILILGFYVIRRFTRRIYQPFGQVIEKVKSSLDSEHYSDNEFEMLNNMINDFSLKQDEIAEITDKYNTVILDKIASDVLQGFASDTEEDLLEQFRLSGAKFEGGEFALFVLQLNPLLLNSFPVQQREYLVFNLIDILYNNFNCVPVRTTSTTIEVIVNGDDLNLYSIAGKMKGLIVQKSLANIYYGHDCHKLTELSKQHKETQQVIKYFYIYGFDNIFYIDDLQKQELDESVIDVKQIQIIENTLRDGNREAFYAECNSLLNDVKTKRHSFNYAQNAIMQIFSVICRVARERKIPLKDQMEFDKIVKNDTFDNSTIFLFDISDSFFSGQENSDTNHQQNLINEIIKYISGNITQDISLVSVAQHFDLSSGYLSKFFKENASTSFSKFVIEKKFEYAATMLTANPKMPISEIAESLGYFDSAYFSRQFKAHYGITPIQYRKNHLN